MILACRTTSYSREELLTMTVLIWTKQIFERLEGALEQTEEYSNVDIWDSSSSKSGEAVSCRNHKQFYWIWRKEYCCAIIRDLTRKKRKNKLFVSSPKGLPEWLAWIFKTLTKYVTGNSACSILYYHRMFYCWQNKSAHTFFVENNEVIENIEYELEGHLRNCNERQGLFLRTKSVQNISERKKALNRIHGCSDLQSENRRNSWTHCCSWQSAIN